MLGGDDLYLVTTMLYGLLTSYHCAGAAARYEEEADADHLQGTHTHVHYAQSTNMLTYLLRSTTNFGNSGNACVHVKFQGALDLLLDVTALCAQIIRTIGRAAFALLKYMLAAQTEEGKRPRRR